MLLKFLMPLFGALFALALKIEKQKMDEKMVLLSGLIITILLDAMQGITLTFWELLLVIICTGLFYLGYLLGKGAIAFYKGKKSKKLVKKMLQTAVIGCLTLVLVTPMGSGTFSYNKENPENEIVVDYGHAKAIWKYLRMNLGCSRAAAAGVLGNMYAESMFDPEALERNGVGHGIGQWSWDRWYGEDGLEAFANSKKQDWSDMKLQLQFLRHEVVENDSMSAYYDGGFRKFKRLRRLNGENGTAKVFFSAFEYGSSITYDEYMSDDFEYKFATRSKRSAVAKFIYNDKRRFP